MKQINKQALIAGALGVVLLSAGVGTKVLSQNAEKIVVESTQAPTQVPTATPTPEPTAIPTFKYTPPTQTPTIAPTASPAKNEEKHTTCTSTAGSANCQVEAGKSQPSGEKSVEVQTSGECTGSHCITCKDGVCAESKN